MSDSSLNVSREAISEICRRNQIRRLSLFGSVLRDDFRADSDVDVLVEFEPGVPVGFRIFQIEEELSSVFEGHKVDIVNRKYLNHRIRDRILAEAEVQYAEEMSTALPNSCQETPCDQKSHVADS